MQFDVPVGHASFGQITRCEICGRGQQQTYLRDLCGMSAEAQRWTFDNTQRTNANGAAYDACELLASNPQRFMTLLSPGKYGVGKTRLLACAVNAARADGHVAIYTTTADVLDYLRNAYAPNAALGYDSRLEILRSAKVLALDEFDRWAPTPWAQEKFFQLIDARYQRSAEMLTLFAANTEIAAVPGYIASRMQDIRSYLFVLSGQDVRRVQR